MYFKGKMFKGMNPLQWLEALAIVLVGVCAVVRFVFWCGSYKTKMDHIQTDMKDIKSEIQALYKILLEKIK